MAYDFFNEDGIQSSLKKIETQAAKTECAFITAYQDYRSDEENREKTEQLKTILRHIFKKYMMVIGGYKEGDTIYEAFCVTNIVFYSGAFIAIIKQLATRFAQEGVFITSPKTESSETDRQGNLCAKIEEFFSTGRQKEFVFLYDDEISSIGKGGHRKIYGVMEANYVASAGNHALCLVKYQTARRIVDTIEGKKTTPYNNINYLDGTAQALENRKRYYLEELHKLDYELFKFLELHKDGSLSQKVWADLEDVADNLLAYSSHVKDDAFYESGDLVSKPEAIKTKLLALRKEGISGKGFEEVFALLMDFKLYLGSLPLFKNVNKGFF